MPLDTPDPPPRSPSGHGSQRVLGPFELVSELGRGGVGVVYRARDGRAGGREVALKVLLHGSEVTPQRLERFRREAILTAALQHPGIVRALDAGVFGGRPWVALELVEGARTLSEVMPTLPTRRRAELIRDAARALGHAHARGVVHRDVKPANILVDRAGAARVTDFGLAAARGFSPLTQSGSLVGTPLWMSPEQAGSRRDQVGPASDVWGLGVILYEALTGAPPFDGPTLVDLVAAISRAAPRPPRQVAPGVDPALEAVCLKALQRDPARRHPDGAALADDLDRALARADADDLARSDTQPGGEPAPAGPTRRALVGVHAALALAGAALLLTLAALRAGAPVDAVARARALEAQDPSAARAAYLLAAEAGDVRAMRPLADLLEGGRGGPADAASAAAWRRRAADGGDAAAQVDLARRAGDPAEAAGWWRRAAEAGDVEAMVALGALLRDGRGLARDPAQATTWLRRAAERGHAGAMRALAEALERDDAALAAQWLRRAADAGDAPAMVALALGEADDPTAAIWLRRAADAGHARAMRLYAERLAAGRGEAADAGAAARWLERAAAAGDAEAMRSLGEARLADDRPAALAWLQRGARAQDRACMVALARAHVAAGEVSAALPWLLQAAALGDGGAAALVGGLFERGDGVPRDDRRAREWFKRAADLGDPGGSVSLGAFMLDGQGGPRDAHQGLLLLRRAAEAGSAAAMHHLGRAHERGLGGPRDAGQARAWYRKAVEAGSPAAMLRLAALLEGEAAGRPEAHTEAADLYRRAAALGDTTAMNNWGHALLQGEGVARDEAAGLGWVRRAAEAGSPQAMTNLSLLLQQGRGAPRDAPEARRWLERAAAAGDARATRLLAEADARAAEPAASADVAALRAAAEQGDPRAAAALGLALRDGRGVERDARAAEAWLRRALDGGHAAALVPLARLLAGRDARGEAAALLEPAVARGDIAATVELGLLLEGAAAGAARDDARAAALLRRAAEQGDAQAMTRLAVLLREGRGGARDAGQAVAWLRRAADAGRADAQALLAEHLAAGLGVARDLTEALRLFAAAANAGEPAAMTGLARLLLAGPETTWAEGARWAHKAAGAGHTPGMVLLAGTLTKGRGVRRSTRNAISYLRRAAERGDGDAVLRLAHLFDDLGRSQAARELSKALADKGDARAMLLLTRLHVSRRAPSTAAEAVRWANLLVERGDPEALLFVARRGAEADAQVTLALLRRAAEAGLPGAMVDLARRLEPSEPAAARGWLERAAALGETEARLLLAAGR